MIDLWSIGTVLSGAGGRWPRALCGRTVLYSLCDCESFNGRMRDEPLNGEIFYSLREAQIVIEEWRHHYNTKKPLSALSYRPPAPETIVKMDHRPALAIKLDHSDGAAQISP